MQTYRVEVAHRETGAADVLYVEALTEQEAAKIANDRGWMVSRTMEAPPVRPTDRPATPTPKPRAPKPRLSVTGVQVLGGVMLLIGLFAFGLRTMDGAGRWELDLALKAQRRQSHSFRDDVAAGATANDINDLLAEVESLRRELRNGMGAMSSGALFWSGVLLLVLGTRRTRDTAQSPTDAG